MTEYRDPCTQHIDQIRDWVEFLNVLDEWSEVTQQYVDVESAPEFCSESGRYGWWATILAEWILHNSNVDPAPLLTITRMIQAKDPLGEFTSFTACAEEIERQLLLWRPYQHILVSRARNADEPQLTVVEQRNKFCFDQWQSGRTLNEINVALKKIPEWEPFEKNLSVRSAIDSWAKRIGETRRRGQSGRRSKT